MSEIDDKNKEEKDEIEQEENEEEEENEEQDKKNPDIINIEESEDEDDKDDELLKNQEKNQEKKKGKKDKSNVKKANNSCNGIFINGIPYETTEEELKKLFSPYGEIEQIKLPKYQDSGRNIGGYIKFCRNIYYVLYGSKRNLFLFWRKI